MADCFITRKGGKISEEAIPDIYNHGNVVGLNPKLFGISERLWDESFQSQCFYTISSSATGYIEINTESILLSYSGNKVFVIPIAINTKGYKYLCVEAEVPRGLTANSYNLSSIGAVERLSPDNKTYTPYYVEDSKKNKVKTFFTNYNQSIYTYPRAIAKIDISELDEIIIGGHNCDCELYIYSIYLSNEE